MFLGVLESRGIYRLGTLIQLLVVYPFSSNHLLNQKAVLEDAWTTLAAFYPHVAINFGL